MPKNEKRSAFMVLLKKNNQEVLTYVKAFDGKLVAQNNVIELQTKGLKEQYLTINKKIQKLKVELNMVQIVLQTSFASEKHPYLWIFSKRQLKQRVAFKKTDAKIEYSKVIKIE